MGKGWEKRCSQGDEIVRIDMGCVADCNLFAKSIETIWDYGV